MLEMGPASNDEMVLAFILAEMDSPRWNGVAHSELLHFQRPKYGYRRPAVFE